MDDQTWVVQDGNNAVLVTVRGPFTLRSTVTFGAVVRKLLMDRRRSMPRSARAYGLAAGPARRITAGWEL